MKDPTDELSFSELLAQTRARAESVLASPSGSAEEQSLARTVVQLTDRLGRSESPEDRPAAGLAGAVDRLKRAVDLMARNALSAEEAGLEGDARRWRVVREDVAAALEELGRSDDV